MRSQTATEYIVLVGVVLVIATIVVTTLGDVSSIGSSDASSQVMLTLNGIGLTTMTPSIFHTQIALINNQPEAITLQAVQINRTTCWLSPLRPNTSQVPLTLAPGERKEYVCLNVAVPSPSFRYEFPVVINYTDVNGYLYSLPIGTAKGVASSRTCPTGFSAVGVFPYIGIPDFCVMTYEAKNVGGVARSQADTTPWASITFTSARTACMALGAKYNLTTNRQWIAMMASIERVDRNWNTSAMNSGRIYTGNTGSNRDYSYNFGGPDFGSNRNTTARLFFSNGQIIWDMSGNVNEWVDVMENGSLVGNSSICASTGFSRVGPGCSSPCTLIGNYNANSSGDLRYALSSGESTACSPVWFSAHNQTYYARRGDNWLNSNGIGLFNSEASSGLSDVWTGFRCTYTP